jgi:hypothetical protein
MGSNLNRTRILTGIAAAGLMLVAAGCQSGGGSNMFGLGGSKAEEPPREVITADALRAYCPRVSLRSGTAFYNTYEKGGEDDSSRIVYQASIADVTRSCSVSGDMLVMNVAAAGKVVPGPKARDGAVTMPIRVAVLRGEEVLYTDMIQHSVQIAANAPATQFIFNNPNVTFPIPTARNIQVFVGYDEGPQARR